MSYNSINLKKAGRNMFGIRRFSYHEHVSNNSPQNIIINSLVSALSLVLFGFGVYLTITADIGAGPWDVLNLGLSKTFHCQYGTASICVALSILAVDILIKEPIGISMILDSVLVGKSVDLFNYLDLVQSPTSLPLAVLLLFSGLIIMCISQYYYMSAALGCGPRDSFLVGLSRHIRFIPIGMINIIILVCATLSGFLLGGKVGIGTLISAVCTGPIMQLVFYVMGFDATRVHHQNLRQSAEVLFMKNTLKSRITAAQSPEPTSQIFHLLTGMEPVLSLRHDSQ